MPALSRREGAALAALVAGAVLVRGVRRLETPLLFNDGPTFLGLAQALGEGRTGDVLAHAYHPLYPVASYLASLATGDLERGAVAVSILAGGASVLFLFAFLRSAFSRRDAWLGSALLAVHPRAVEWSADVQSDGLFLALFLAAVSALWHARRSGRAGGFVVAGLVTGLAFLTRPEGLVVAAVASLAFATDVLRARAPILRTLGQATLFGVATSMAVVPYVAAVRAETGSVRLTGKKPVSALLRFEDRRPDEGAASAPEAPKAAPPGADAGEVSGADGASAPSEPAALRRARTAAAKLATAVLSGLRPWFAAILLLGALARWRTRGEETAFVGLFVGVDLVLGTAQILHAGYLDMRHVFPPLVPAFGWFAAGIDSAARGVRAGWARARRVEATDAVAAAPGRLSAVFAALALAAALGQALRPDGPRAHAERAAAEWLRAHAGAPGGVAAPKTRLAWYARRKPVGLYHAPAEGMGAWLREQGARYVIVTDESVRKFPGLRSGDVALGLRYCTTRGPRWAAVYEIGAASDGRSPEGDAACAAAAQDAVRPADGAEAG